MIVKCRTPVPLFQESGKLGDSDSVSVDLEVVNPVTLILDSRPAPWMATSASRRHGPKGYGGGGRT